MDNLSLALKSRLPLIHVTTDDLVNVEFVLSHIAGKVPVAAMTFPDVIKSGDKMSEPTAGVIYTSSETKSMLKVYHWAVQHDISVVFVNTEPSKLHFVGGTMFPPQDLVLEYLAELSDDPESLMAAFGGLTIKDIGEVAKMTMTRDESLTPKGINETRRGYNNLRGITPVDTAMNYYDSPSYLTEWLSSNTQFFVTPVHASLTPRGLLFDGPPGTGKTAGAKYIASTFGVPLYRMDLGAMMGKYVGESETNLNSALAQIDQVQPCVVILDEVEKLFKGNSDSGVTSRLLSALLWWLQEHKSQVFTVMTTNDIEAIPPELYREGRIDATMEFLGVVGYAKGLEFTKGAFDIMLKELGATADEASYKELGKRVKTMYADNQPVPQSKLTQTAYGYVREMVAELQSGDVAVASPNPATEEA